MSEEGAKERIDRSWEEARRWAEEHSWTDDRFDPDRPLRETAKFLLADIRAAVRTGELPPGVGPHAWRTH